MLLCDMKNYFAMSQKMSETETLNTGNANGLKTSVP